MKQWHYFYHGLQVTSQLEIPEWAGFENGDAARQADVSIHVENALSCTDECKPDAPVVRTGEFCFCVPDVATYRVWQGHTIEVVAAPGAGWREVRIYLLGTAWGALCYQRGLFVLHASVVQVGNGAVAFCAQPGMGKSTLAAWLVETGYTLLSDDLTCIEFPALGQPLIYPSVPRLKLWQDALDALDWNSSALERDHYRYEKFHLPVSGMGRGAPMPLQMIYVLEWGDPHLSRLTGQTALLRLVRAATYRGGLLEPLGKMGDYWQQCIELARRVPVWELQRPRDLAGMRQTVQLLQEHWSSQLIAAQNEKRD